MTAPESPEAVPPQPSTPGPGGEPVVDPSEQLELKLPDESSNWRDLGLWAGVLVLLVLVAYWPAVGGPFQWLDGRPVAQNRLLAMPGGLGDVWAGGWQNRAAYPFPLYQPVAFTADWVAYRLGGHNENGLPTPTAYHVLALACQAGAAVLAWLALRELGVAVAWLAAAVFALHPANADAVSWVSDGGVTVGGLAFFGSAYCYLVYQRYRARDAAATAAGTTDADPAQTWGLYAGAAALAVAAALAWPAAGAVPGVLLLALWWRRRLTQLDVALLAPVLAVTAVLWLLDLGLTRPAAVVGGVHAVADLSPARAAAAVGAGFWFAVAKVLVPVRLSLIYPTGWVERTATLVALLPLVAAVAVVAAPFALARRFGRGPAAALAAVALCVVPGLNWTDPRRATVLANSAVYPAVLPLALLVLTGAAAVLRRVRSGEGHTQLVVVASAVLLVVLGGTAWARSHTFETPVRLWRDTSTKAPGSAFAAAQLAEQYRLQATEDAAREDADQSAVDLDAAQREAARAVDLAGSAHPLVAAAAQRTWAAALVATGDDGGALPHFDLATRPVGDGVGPDAPTLVEYGQALVTLGDHQKAVTELDLALGADPQSAAAHRVLARAYHKLGNEARCLTEARLAVGLDGRDLAAQQELAEALVRAGRLDEGIEHYIAIFKTDPSTQQRADLWAAVGRVKMRQGAYDEAVTYFAQAAKLSPPVPGLDKELADARAKLKVAAVTRPAMTRPSTEPTAPAAGTDVPPGP